MATIALYAGKINQMPGLIKDIKTAVTDYKSELSALKTKTMTINRSVCNVDDVISSIQSSAQTQERKITSLDTFNRNNEEFVSDVAVIDSEAADTVRKRKEDFYKQYSYLKPECEKSGWEKFKDGLKSAGEWCREHWKLIVTIVIVIAAIVVIVCFPAAAPFLVMAAKGALLGALSGGLMGGAMSLLSGESFWKGFEEGAFSGALMGALFGGLGGAGQMFGGSCRVMQALGGTEKVFRVISKTAKISAALSAVMGGYDMLAFGIGLFDPSNPLVTFNQKLHSSALYNAFQFTVGAVAAFSGGAYLRMKQGPPTCFVAGTMILTAAGLAAIENIKAGDKVIAANPDTLETEEKTVLETYVREVRRLVHLTVGRELISTTSDHPFYVNGKGFVNAGELQTGDELINTAGEACPVENIRVEIVERPEKVYNFQVEGFHTYYAGSSGVLVHNAEYGAGGGNSYTYENGRYEGVDYHSDHMSGKKNPAPQDGQFALDNSVSIGENTTRRISLDINGDFVVLDETSPGIFHGHVRTWSSNGGNQGLTQAMKNALYEAGYIKLPTGARVKLTDLANALLGRK